MATNEEYLAAFARVEAGTAKEEDLRLTKQAANNAGSWGGQAREALRKSGKK